MDYIPVNEPVLDGNEKKYLIDCIDTGWISSEGSYVKDFEDGVASYVGRKYGIAVCNGTAAIDVAVAALELKAGDEVIMPDFTIISCVQALVMRGIIPVFVDACPDTWNMDVSQIEEKITPKTKAIMVVHIYGLPVDMEPVLELAEKYKLKVIEDAAEAHGLKYKDRMCGSFGDISIMSFYPNKHITTGEGGMVLVDNENLAQRCRSLRNLCFSADRRFKHEELGYNYRMSNIQAAIGLAQLEKINDHLEKKRQIGKVYTELLGGSELYSIPIKSTEFAENLYWVFGIVLAEDVSMNAEEAIHKLASEGIGCRPFFYPMHQQPVLIKNKMFKEDGKYPVAEYIAEKGFYIPSGLSMTKEKMEYVAKKVKKVVGEK